MKFLMDPRLFNYAVIALFACAAVRWGFAGNWTQVAYWVGAIMLNVAVALMAAQ